MYSPDLMAAYDRSMTSFNIRIDRFNSVDAADYTPPSQRRAAAAARHRAAKGSRGSGGNLVAPLISIDMCRQFPSVLKSELNSYCESSGPEGRML